MTSRASTVARRFHRLDANLVPAFTRHLQRFFSDQAARVLYRFLLAIPAAQWDRATKDDFDELPIVPPTAEELLPDEEKQRLWLALLPYLFAAINNSANLAGDLVGLPELVESDPRIMELLRDSGTRIAGINRTTLNAIRTTLADGVSRGYSARQIAYGVPDDGFRGLRDTVKETYKGRAETIARNEIANVRALAAADRFQEAGVAMVYITDGPGCFVGETRLFGYRGLTELVRQWYGGPSIRLLTAESHDLTVGPHHPVLTSVGWIQAEDLCPGDEIICDSRLKASQSGAVADFVKVPTTENLFRAGYPLGGRPARGRDLHGDAIFGQGEIEVVVPEWGLLLEPDAAFSKHFHEHEFVRADTALSHEAGNSSLFGFPVSLFSASSSDVRGRELSDLLFGSQSFPLSTSTASDRTEPIWPTLAWPDDRDTAPFTRESVGRGEPRPADNRHFSLTGLGHTGSRAEHSTRSASQRSALGTWRAVTLVAVEHKPFSGWMYDATAGAGVLNANGITIRNCGWASHNSGDSAAGSIRTLIEYRQTPFSHVNCQRVAVPHLQ